MDSLLASGTVEGTPESIATFLREHKEALDTTQIGEYFGHHEDQAVPPPFPTNPQQIRAKQHADEQEGSAVF